MQVDVRVYTAAKDSYRTIQKEVIRVTKTLIVVEWCNGEKRFSRRDGWPPAQHVHYGTPKIEKAAREALDAEMQRLGLETYRRKK